MSQPKLVTKKNVKNKVKVKFKIKFVKKKEHKNKVQVQDKVAQKDVLEEKGTLFLLSHFLLHPYQ